MRKLQIHPITHQYLHLYNSGAIRKTIYLKELKSQEFESHANHNNLR